LEYVPELAKYAQTAVRLHPRRGKVADLGASKIGGTFLWPKNEPWPTCPVQKKLYAVMGTWETEKFRRLFSETGTGDGYTFYQWVLSTCPGNKLGGYVSWLQDPRDRPVCECGRPMQHLLTITDTECDGGTFYRWLAKEDRHLWDDNSDELREVTDAIGLAAFAASSMYLFICRKCKKWPIGVAFQR
jgi:hypothetical protein